MKNPFCVSIFNYTSWNVNTLHIIKPSTHNAVHPLNGKYGINNPKLGRNACFLNISTFPSPNKRATVFWIQKVHGFNIHQLNERLFCDTPFCWVQGILCFIIIPLESIMMLCDYSSLKLLMHRFERKAFVVSEVNKNVLWFAFIWVKVVWALNFSCNPVISCEKWLAVAGNWPAIGVYIPQELYCLHCLK